MTRRKFLVALVSVSLVSTCSVGTGGDTPDEEDEPLVQRRHKPTTCAHLYNVGRHREWAECMGVGYK